MSEEVYLGLGSNLGDRADNIHKALSLLQGKTQLKAVSSLYETAPMYFPSQPHFLNAVCCVFTDMQPFELFTFIKGVELSLGRRPTLPKGPRIIDIDVLLYGSLALDTPLLTIPHPAMTERAFVLVPLVEIAPEVVHPVLKITAAELLKMVEGKEGVRLWLPSRKSGSQDAWSALAHGSTGPP
ncbi:MAG: 2-amino-4-hydroxy-6-hydroxymethyldihydropteridine diphosphokinase [Chloroflexi bacterium]|nr:2-amino-4-hydroxy-6-hydroxymethyldihydropteridine diphosphokinase [Chloroflexota bacterium]